MRRPVLHALLLSVALSAAGMAFALWRVGGAKALLRLGGLAPSHLVLAVSALLASFVLAALRLMFVCRALGDSVGLWHALRAHVLGMFSAAVTPGGSGSIAGLALTLDLQGVARARSWAAALATMAADTTFHAWAMPLSLVGLYALGAYPRTPLWAALGVAVIVLTCLLAYVLLFKVAWLRPLLGALLRGPLLRFRRRGMRFVDDFIANSKVFASAPLWKHLAIQLFTAGAWGAFFLVLYFLLLGLGVRIGVPLALAGQTVVAVMSTFVPTPGGSGFFEVVLSWFLVGRGGGEAGPAAVFAWRLITFYSLFVLGPLLGGYLVVKQVGETPARGGGA